MSMRRQVIIHLTPVVRSLAERQRTRLLCRFSRTALLLRNIIRTVRLRTTTITHQTMGAGNDWFAAVWFVVVWLVPSSPQTVPVSYLSLYCLALTTVRLSDLQPSGLLSFG
jgi:hypothetical protein